MKNYQNTIVVFGCTGTVGKYVLEGLVKENCQVRGVLRNAQKKHPIPLANQTNLSYVSADLENPKEVESACAFADVVFLLTATHPKQIEYETNVIKSAQKTEIKRVVKLSAPDIQPSSLVEVSRWHRQIEAILEESNLEYCCLRPSAFMQNWERNNTFTIQRFGKFYGAMQNAPRNYVDARDVAEIAVKFLLQESPIIEKMVTIMGAEAINNHEMAKRISKISGRKIQYIDMPANEFKNMLVNRAKVPHWLANHIVELEELAIKIPESSTATTEQFLNKKPRLMDAYLHEIKEMFSKRSVLSFAS